MFLLNNILKINQREVYYVQLVLMLLSLNRLTSMLFISIFSCDEQLRCHSVRVFVRVFVRPFVHPLFFLLVSLKFHLVLKSFNGVSRKF